MGRISAGGALASGLGQGFPSARYRFLHQEVEGRVLLCVGGVAVPSCIDNKEDIVSTLDHLLCKWKPLHFFFTKPVNKVFLIFPHSFCSL